MYPYTMSHENILLLQWYAWMSLKSLNGSFLDITLKIQYIGTYSVARQRTTPQYHEDGRVKNYQIALGYTFKCMECPRPQGPLVNHVVHSWTNLPVLKNETRFFCPITLVGVRRGAQGPGKKCGTNVILATCLMQFKEKNEITYFI
jgi:hypothetical protein